ncbi:MAG: hypothetical protein WC587_00125 [Candidatus Paceibacterota bacterium]
MSKKTTFLFANPSFTEGVARVIDIGGTLQIYNESKTPKEADVLAIKSDWESVGEDVKNAMGEYEHRE